MGFVIPRSFWQKGVPCLDAPVVFHPQIYDRFCRLLEVLEVLEDLDLLDILATPEDEAHTRKAAYIMFHYMDTNGTHTTNANPA